MKNNQSTPKPNNPFTNLLMQLLHWLTHLELSWGHIGERDKMERLPESSFESSIKGNRKTIN